MSTSTSTSAPSIAEAIALAQQPSQPHAVEHDGRMYTIHLPARATMGDRDYYGRLLRTRLVMGFIPASAKRGTLAGSYAWEVAR